MLIFKQKIKNNVSIKRKINNLQILISNLLCYCIGSLPKKK